MNRLHIDLPESLYEQVRTLAGKEGVSMDEFIALALVEKSVRHGRMIGYLMR